MSADGQEFSAEFALVAACCRWPTDAVAIRAAATAAIDWNRVVQLSRRHRVIGFVRHGLMAVGIAVPASLEAMYLPMVRHNLLQYAEAVRIAGRLADAGIAVAFLKGVVVAELAFGSQTIKQTVDNDLLVAPADVLATIAMLERAGYRIVIPVAIDRAHLPLMVQVMNECQLIHPETGANTDLHWRLHAHRHLFAEPVVAIDTVSVSVAGKPLPALTGEALMLYLAVHGARHCWSRLKWLADFNAMVTGMGPQEIARLRAEAERSGMTPCFDSALIQCERIFGTSVPTDVHRSRRAVALARLSDSLMAARDPHLAPREYARAWLASTVMMTTRLRAVPSIFWHLWVSPNDAFAVPLPKPLHPLYLAISPARRVGRLVARGFARGKSRIMRAAPGEMT